MRLDRSAHWIESWARPFSAGMSTVGAVALLIMMFWVVADVLLRFLFDRPLLGSYEIVEYMMVAFVFMSFAYAQFCKAHISVPVVVERLGPRARAVLDIITGIITLLVTAVMVWGALKQTQDMWAAHMTSAVLFIPKWPFQLITGIGLLAFCVAKLVDVLMDLYQISAGKVVVPESSAEELRSI
ncbi:MAG TPA: TRAP transporter small permease [Chloroflexota bacterium]|nr:TRAP transporter small permease [Chloroflexota bacterium]